MTRWAAALGVLLAGALVARAGGIDPKPQIPGPSSQLPAPSSQFPDPESRIPHPASRQYVGSAACERCHEEEHRLWSRSLHVQMTRPIADARVEGDFANARLEQYGRSYRMEQRDGKYLITVTRGGTLNPNPEPGTRNPEPSRRPPETYEVHYTLGARRFQGYLSKLADGRIYVLPIFWHNEYRRWIDWKEITPIPDGDHDLRQIWNISCFNCHATNLVKNFDTATRTYATSWTDMGIGCEACHGPGAEHVRWGEKRELGSGIRGSGLGTQDSGGPESKQRTPGAASAVASGSRLPNPESLIFNPRTAKPRAVFDTCSYCHGNKVNVFTGFAAGDRYDDYAQPFLISQPIPPNDPQGDFWPDGRPNRFNRPQALMMSGCFRKGEIACTNCHAGHGSRNDHALKIAAYARDGSITSRSDQLCTQCHKEPDSGFGIQDSGGPESSRRGPRAATAVLTESQIPDPESWVKHSHHSSTSQGSRCVGCHMADLSWRLMIRRRDHTFLPPVPELTAAFGEPNACNTCHDDKSPEWAASMMDRWYGNGERRRAALETASAMYDAGAGTVEAVPRLARIALDRTQGAPMRASAAEFIGRLIEASRGGARVSAAGVTSGSQTSFTRGDPGFGNRSGGQEASQRGTVAAPAIAPESRIPDPESRQTVNALIGAASDPEAIVRAAAVKTLGLIGASGSMDPNQPAAPDQRIAMALFARLVDVSRVVRVTAAEALLRLGIVDAPDRAGAALARTQEEYAAHLRGFPDDAAQHVALGWLELLRGRNDDARRALETAKALDPEDARAWLFSGVVLARAGRYEDAIREWQAARRLNPGLGNLDRLIDEARRRTEKKR